MYILEGNESIINCLGISLEIYLHFYLIDIIIHKFLIVPKIQTYVHNGVVFFHFAKSIIKVGLKCNLTQDTANKMHRGQEKNPVHFLPLLA